MSCKVLVVTGSPRVGGNSDTLAEAFIEGAKSAGCEVRRIDAGRAKIAGCLGCNYCFSHEGVCVQQDDMQQFYPDLHWADVLVYATPLYCFTYPAQLKAFQDRMFCGIAKSFNIPRVGLLRVDYGGTSFLFTGDMEQNAEADLMDSGANVRADVLKAGHHGSPTSSSEAFLEAVAPSIAVISVGENNDYGHPSADVLARLEALGTTIYRTDTQGEIIITSDGQTLTVTTDPTSREPAAGKDAPFIGNRNSMIVHSANCAKLPGEDNRVYFNTAEEAEEYGYQKHTCIK